MANQNAQQDDNHYPALTAHTGTSGTAETVKVTSSVTAGAVDVAVVSGSFGDLTIGNIGTVGTIPGIGTLTNAGSLTNVGTVKEITNIAGGTVVVTGVGTVVNIATGTQQTLGTVGVVNNLVKGTITKVEGGSIAVTGLPDPLGSVVVTAGTVTTSLALNTGTITTIAAGTQNTLGTVGTVIGVGTISNTVTTSGTVTGVGVVTSVGSLTNIGTLKGVDLVTRIGNIGTIESGTVTTTLALNTGTLTTIAAGTQNTLGTVGVVNNLVKGTVTKLEGGTWSAWGQITAGTNQYLLCGVNYWTIFSSGTASFSGELPFHLQIGTGAAASEVPVANFSATMGIQYVADALVTSAAQIGFGQSLFCTPTVIGSNVRIAARTTTSQNGIFNPISALYTTGYLQGTNPLPAKVDIETYRRGMLQGYGTMTALTSETSVSTGTASFLYGTPVEIITATEDRLLLYGVTSNIINAIVLNVHGVTQIGTGAAGAEVWLTEVGMPSSAGIPGPGAGYYRFLRPIVVGPGVRVAARVKTSGATVRTWTMNLNYEVLT